MSRHETGEKLRDTLNALAKARSPDHDERNDAPLLVALKRWQSERLGQSFTGLLADDRYQPAAEFFLSDLYGSGDVSWRDRDVTRVLPTMVRWLPEKALVALNGALELDLISHQQDLLLCEHLPGPSIDTESYARAYRASCDEALRHRQIDLIVDVGRELERLVKVPLILGVLKLARGPARGAGFGQLQSFLERGFAAFRHMGPADHFLRTIEQGERQVMQRLLNQHADPFGFGQTRSKRQAPPNGASGSPRAATPRTT
ncbi:hypothetical protein C7S18_13770 [Ahniella affigens]|uniref:DUF8198 domain-containing protein n=1 Tax=Ahniella affigens TaxID=2021234 RepID=A0A2P1PTM4_9GAMM|nr:hypothetical protein [Ahniella affigens]AVP98194.1 hypothetical protein C7S18_13770 [Ahniella affigens]